MKVSPSDGRVLNFGVIEEKKVEQVKGVTYSLEALLGIKSKDRKNIEPHHAAHSIAEHSHAETVASEQDFANINMVDYSLDRILGDDPNQTKKFETSETDSHYHGHHSKKGNALFFCVIYLAPGDYHRFHSPTNWTVESRRHIHGKSFCG